MIIQKIFPDKKDIIFLSLILRSFHQTFWRKACRGRFGYYYTFTCR